MNFFSRRKLLSNTGRLAAAAFPAIVNAGNPGPAASTPQSHKLKIIVTGGHPGDPEYGCGGTIARYTDLGNEVVLLYLNRGEGGSPKLPPGQLGALRTTEA